MLKSFFQSIIIALVLALSGFLVATAAPQTFVQDGNSFGTTATLGTNDNFPLAFETNGSTKVQIDASGNVTMSGALQVNGLANLLGGASITCNGCLTTDNIASVLTNKTLSTGSTWSGNTIGTSVGGTGLSSIGTSNQVLGVDNAGTSLEYKTVSGTTNQVNVSNSAGNITLSTPQDIHTGAAPTFAGLTSNGQVYSTAGGYKFPDGTVQTTAATPTPPPTPTVPLFAQAISSGNSNYEYNQITSKYNSGDVLWAVLTSSDTGGTQVIERYIRDTTGHYYRTNSLFLIDRNPNGKVGIAAVGDYVYTNFVHSSSGQYRVYRYLAADLTDETQMTIIGPPDVPPFTSDNNRTFADADDLYFFNWRDGNHLRYTISGTTLTNAGTIITTSLGNGGYWSDDINIFAQSGGDLKKKDFAGGPTIEYNRGLQTSVPAIDSKPRGLVYASSTAVYTIYFGKINWSPYPGHNLAWMIPISKP